MAKKESFLGPTQNAGVNPNLISSKVKRHVKKREGALSELTRDEKLVCALRKALASKSGLAEALGARYYISGENLYVMNRGGGVQTKKGEPTTYTASGRFKMGVAYESQVVYRMAEFRITYKDTLDERGLPDVDFIDPTTIDLLSKGEPLVPPSAQ